MDPELFTSLDCTYDKTQFNFYKISKIESKNAYQTGLFKFICTRTCFSSSKVGATQMQMKTEKSVLFFRPGLRDSYCTIKSIKNVYHSSSSWQAGSDRQFCQGVHSASAALRSRREWGWWDRSWCESGTRVVEWTRNGELKAKVRFDAIATVGRGSFIGPTNQKGPKECVLMIW